MWWRVEGVRGWRGWAVVVCTMRLVTTKCQCQAKRTAMCGCVKRTTPHSSIEKTVYCVHLQNFDILDLAIYSDSDNLILLYTSLSHVLMM